MKMSVCDCFLSFKEVATFETQFTESFKCVMECPSEVRQIEVSLNCCFAHLVLLKMYVHRISYFTAGSSHKF